MREDERYGVASGFSLLGVQCSSYTPKQLYPLHSPEGCRHVCHPLELAGSVAQGHKCHNWDLHPYAVAETPELESDMN